jgi:hypothetical protein
LKHITWFDSRECDQICSSKCAKDFNTIYLGHEWKLQRRIFKCYPTWSFLKVHYVLVNCFFICPDTTNILIYFVVIFIYFLNHRLVTVSKKLLGSFLCEISAVCKTSRRIRSSVEIWLLSLSVIQLVWLVVTGFNKK